MNKRKFMPTSSFKKEKVAFDFSFERLEAKAASPRGRAKLSVSAGASRRGGGGQMSFVWSADADRWTASEEPASLSEIEYIVGSKDAK